MNTSPPSTQETSYSKRDEVTRRADVIAIVATGTSIRNVQFSFAPHVYVIAVKGAIDAVQADAWMTVDCNKWTRERYMTDLRPGIEYYAAVPDDYGREDARLLYHRPPAEEGVHWLRRVGANRHGTYGLSEDRSSIHTGNSAYGALGLAYHMQPKRIGIFGVDGTQGEYGIGEGHPRGGLSHLPALFRTAVPQLSLARIEVALSPTYSRVRCFPRMQTERLIDWLNER